VSDLLDRPILDPPSFTHLPPPPRPTPPPPPSWAVGPPPPVVPPAQTASRWNRRRLAAVALCVFVVGAFLGGYEPAGALLVGFAVLSPLERRFRRHPWTIRRPQMRTDVLHLLFSGTLLTGATIIGIVGAWLATWPLHRGTLDGPLSTLSPVWAGVVGFVLFEMFGYGGHRLSHEVPFLWRFHAVHHSSQRLDWISAGRLHPVEGLFAGLMVGPPLLLLGLQPAELGAFTVIVNLWGVLLHANVRWRFAFLDGIIGTPDYHHWHHSNHPEARNKNYAALLPVLDRLFGTYFQPKDRRPQVYGIDEPMPATWWQQLRWPLRRQASARRWLATHPVA